jgi:hypothetical protein
MAAARAAVDERKMSGAAGTAHVSKIRRGRASRNREGREGATPRWLRGAAVRSP